MSNDINLASLWVPVMAETSHIKGQLSTAGAEGAAIFAQAFTGSGVFKDIGKQLQNSLGTSLPSGLLRGFDDLAGRTKTAEEAVKSYQKTHESLTAALSREQVAQSRLNDLQEANVTGTRLLSAQASLESAHRKVTAATEADAAALNARDAAMEASTAKTRAFSVANGVGIAALVGFTAAVVSSGKAAGDFQASMTRLQASAGESADNLKAVGDGVLQLAGKVGYGAQDLANAMYTVEKAGFRGADGVNVLTAAAQGAKSENADLKEVLSGLTTSMNDFNYTPAQAADVMSKMVAAVGMAKSNFQDFAGALHSVEPAAAAVHISLADVYGSLAQITQSGTSPAQAAENMAHAIQTLSKPTQQMRDEMGQFGLNAVDVQQKIGERGLAGTMQYLSNTIRDHMDPAGQVIVDTMYKSQQATDSAKQIFDALPPAAQKVAQTVKDHAEAYKAFRKDRGGLDVEQANQVQQWLALNNKITGFSTALKTGQGSVQTYLQALSLMVGGQDAARIALQLTGENADKTNKGIQEIDQTTREHDGTVKGFNETQTTLNAKIADFKAAMGAARIELGTAFLPVLTDVAGALANVGQFLAEHKDLAEHLTEDVGLLAAAWLLVKGAMVGKEIWMGLSGAMEALGAKIGIAAGATKELAVAETDVAGASAAAAGGIDLVGASATTAQTGVAGLSRLLGPLMAAFLVIQNGPDIQKWIEDHVPGGKFLDSIPNPGDAGKATRDWVNQHILGDTPPPPPAPPPPPGQPFNPADIRSPGSPPSSGGLPGILPHAAGGIFGGSMPSSAKIQSGSGSGLIQWAEESTGGEAYIPLAGGDRSKQIWAQTGHLLGVFDQGGFNGVSVLPPSNDAEPPQQGVEAAINLAQRASGQPYGYGGVGGPSSGGLYDCSGFMSSIYAAITGKSYGGNERYFTTESDFTKLGFIPTDAPVPGAFNIGVHNGGGGMNSHMAGTLPNGVNVESGGATDSTQYGGSAAGAWSSEFEKHYYLPTGGTQGMGYGTDGRRGYYMPDPKKVEAAQTRIDTLNGDIQVLEQRKSEETDKTKESEKMRIDNELKTKTAELDKAKADLAAAQQGTFHADRNGRESKGTGQDKTESEAQQFGSGLLKGLMSDLGFGNVLGGKSPLDWGIVKLLGGLAGWGLGEANAVGDAMSGQSGAGGGGGNIVSGAFGAIPNIKNLIPHSPTALAPSLVSTSMADPNGTAHGTSQGAAPGPTVVDQSFNVTQHGVSAPIADWKEQYNASAPRGNSPVYT